MAWKIKQVPEDFIVREILPYKTTQSWKEKMRKIRGEADGSRGGFVWFTMKKTDVGFFEAIEAITGGLGIGTSRICYSGVKDKRAVTFQTVSVEGVKQEELEALKTDGIELSDMRARNRHVRLGEHDGNAFEITTRNIEQSERERIGGCIADIGKDGIVNFFGPQRFGEHGDNHLKGKKLLEGEYEPPSGMPLRLQKLFVHAYQAHLWNLIAGEMLKEGKAPKTIPIPGYRTVLERYPETEGVIARVLKKEGMELQDFRCTRFPKLSSKGDGRPFRVVPKGLGYELGEDELNPGRMKLVLRFDLPKGSYATEVLRQLERESGF